MSVEAKFDATMTVHAIVLAAGAGTRFGADPPKLLASWRGRPLIEPVLATLASAQAEGLVSEVFVVYPPEHPAIGTLAHEAGFDAVLVTRSRPAISETIKAGMVTMTAMHDLRGVSGVLLVLGDQPKISVDAIRAVIARAAGSPAALVRPRYAGAPEEPGHPVFVGRVHFGLLEATEGDQGLDAVVKQQGREWRYVELPGTNPDVDTPEDLKTL